MLCEFNRPVCVVGSFNSGPDTGLKEEGETMKRWGGKDSCTLAKQNRPRVLIHGSLLLISYFCTYIAAL